MSDSERIIHVEALSRVEGEGGLFVRLAGREIEQVELRIFEPPRFFEAFLRGRSFEETPDIVARICGICPVAYQMSAVHALERAFGVEITPEIRRLRRLLYCGEWMESHSLHIHLLHAPDFLGCASGLEMAKLWPNEVQRGLRLKKYGNRLLDVLGGRAIHPINVAVGGFYRAPRREELSALVPDLQWSRDAAIEATRWVSTFEFPDFERDFDFVALVHPDEYAINEGEIRSSRGEGWHVDQYEAEFHEHQAPHSTALHSVRKSSAEPYHVGPLARVNLSFDRLSPLARQVAADLPIRWPCRNPYMSIVARGLELIHAFDEALAIIGDYRPCSPRVETIPRVGEGCAATEAPRGLLYHRYRTDAQGKIEFAKIVPPTSQNQGQMESDLRAWLPRVLDQPEEVIAHTCEHVVRNYDPCISCSTHFLRLTLDRQ